MLNSFSTRPLVSSAAGPRLIAKRGRGVRALRLRRTTAVLVAAVFAFPTLAVAGSATYANGVLGAGGSWKSPTSGFVFLTWNRMSIQPTKPVQVCQGVQPSGIICYPGTRFVQWPDPGPLNGQAWAQCLNAQSNGPVSGYCTRYN